MTTPTAAMVPSAPADLVALVKAALDDSFACGAHTSEDNESHATVFDRAVASHEALLAAVGRMGRGAAPEGWRLVPVEPTPEMVAASLTVTATWRDISGTALTVNREKMRLRWRAILGAAPPPPPSREPVEPSPPAPVRPDSQDVSIDNGLMDIPTEPSPDAQDSREPFDG